MRENSKRFQKRDIDWTNLLQPAKEQPGFVHQKLVFGIEDRKGLAVDLFTGSK